MSQVYKYCLILGLCLSALVFLDYFTADVSAINATVNSVTDYPKYQVVSVTTKNLGVPYFVGSYYFGKKENKLSAGDAVKLKARHGFMLRDTTISRQ